MYYSKHYSKIAAAFVVSSSLLLVGCSQQLSEEQPTVVEEASSTGSSQQTGEVRDITIDAFKYEFSQDVIIAKPGDTLTIKLSSSDGFHDFVIDELGVATEQINEGETTMVTFTIPQDAADQIYQYYCSVSNHRELGMIGKLIIEK